MLIQTAASLVTFSIFCEGSTGPLDVNLPEALLGEITTPGCEASWLRHLQLQCCSTLLYDRAFIPNTWPVHTWHLLYYFTSTQILWVCDVSLLFSQSVLMWILWVYYCIGTRLLVRKVLVPSFWNTFQILYSSCMVQAALANGVHQIYGCLWSIEVNRVQIMKTEIHTSNSGTFMFYQHTVM